MLDAATHEFAVKGLHGASTEDIARAAGISQPYLFRLFGTKKQLYLATVERAVDHLYAVFAEAARGSAARTRCTRWARPTTTVMADRDRLMLHAQVLGRRATTPRSARPCAGSWRDLVDLRRARLRRLARGGERVLLEGRAAHRPRWAMEAFDAAGALVGAAHRGLPGRAGRQPSLFFHTIEVTDHKQFERKDVRR